MIPTETPSYEYGFYPIQEPGSSEWRWCVVGSVSWEIGRPGSGFWVTIADGTITDMASIPSYVRWILGGFLERYDPQTALAAAKHDRLLELGYHQHFAAGEFYRYLEEAGTPRWKRKLYFAAVTAAIDHW